VCPGCNDVNFGSRQHCRKCGAPKPASGGDGVRPERAEITAKPGDWICVQCAELNFASRSVCRKCNCPKLIYKPDVWG